MLLQIVVFKKFARNKSHLHRNARDSCFFGTIRSCEPSKMVNFIVYVKSWTIEFYKCINLCLLNEVDEIASYACKK